MNHNSDEITLKELILKVRAYWKELWRYWWQIGLICIPFIAFFIYKTFTTEPTYPAQIRFIVQGDSGGVGGLSGLLGSIGLSKPGSVNPYKILEVGRSKRIMSSVLMGRLESDTLLANRILDIYELNKKWGKKKPEFLDFRFEQKTLDSMDVLSRIAFNKLYKVVIGSKKDRRSALCNISLNEEEGIFSLGALTTNPEASLMLVTDTYDKLKYFFEEETLEEQKKTRDLLKEKADSIKALINYKTHNLARFEDRNRGLILHEKRIEQQNLMLEIEGLTVAFAEAIKNFELADYNYKDSKPLFIEIDRPVPPLEIIAQSLIFNIFIAGILGCLVGALFVILRKIYRDTMSND